MRAKQTDGRQPGCTCTFISPCRFSHATHTCEGGVSSSTGSSHSSILSFTTTAVMYLFLTYRYGRVSQQVSVQTSPHHRRQNKYAIHSQTYIRTWAPSWRCPQASPARALSGRFSDKWPGAPRSSFDRGCCDGWHWGVGQCVSCRGMSGSPFLYGARRMCAKFTQPASELCYTYAGFCSVMVARMIGMLMHCTNVDVTSAGRALSWC